MSPIDVDRSQWLRPGEAAEMLGVKPTTVSDWARQEKIPSFRTPGGQWRFRRLDIERILREGTVRPAARDSRAAS